MVAGEDVAVFSNNKTCPRAFNFRFIFGSSD